VSIGFSTPHQSPYLSTYANHGRYVPSGTPRSRGRCLPGLRRPRPASAQTRAEHCRRPSGQDHRSRTGTPPTHAAKAGGTRCGSAVVAARGRFGAIAIVESGRTGAARVCRRHPLAQRSIVTAMSEDPIIQRIESFRCRRGSCSPSGATAATHSIVRVPARRSPIDLAPLGCQQVVGIVALAP
jgi:hypothetical protein